VRAIHYFPETQKHLQARQCSARRETVYSAPWWFASASALGLIRLCVARSDISRGSSFNVRRMFGCRHRTG